MKSNDFRHLCDNRCSEDVSLLYFVKFVTLVLFWSWKSTMSKKLSPVVSIVSSNNESEGSIAKDLGLVRRVCSCTNGQK